MQKLFFDRALLPDGWADSVLVEIEGGQFKTVTSGKRRTVDSQHVVGVALPGVGNLHSHTFQRGLAGLTERRGVEDDHFWTWRDAMYRFVGKLMPEDAEAIAAMAFIEMIESGFTAVAEFHYLHHAPNGQPYADPAEISRRIVSAAAETGIGLTLLPVFYAHSGFGARPPTRSQSRFVCDLDLFARLHASAGDAIANLPIGGIGIAPHSLRAVTMEELKFLLGLHAIGPVHLHIAEQEREVEECIAATGSRPVDWLLGEVAIDDRWCLVHATHMTTEETRRFARTGATAGLCPVTESNLGDGIFPAVDFLDAGGGFGVGSDSNVSISLKDELRTLCYSQRLRDKARNRFATATRSSGRVLFETALRGGAQALGLPVGGIAPGLRADVVMLDSDHVALAGRSGDDILDAWIFATAEPIVASVYLGGKRVVTAGRHHARERIAAAYIKTMLRLESM